MQDSDFENLENIEKADDLPLTDKPDQFRLSGKIFISNSITVLLFLMIVGGITVLLQMKEDVTFSEQENRYLAEKPKMSISALMNEEFEKQYESYLSDQFIFRNQWISFRTGMELLFQRKEVNGVYFAADNYLVELLDSKKFENDLALKNYKYLSEFTETYSKIINGSLSVMLVPDKAALLKDKLPKFVFLPEEQKIITEIYKQCSGAKCIDIYGKLQEHSDEYIYYKTDHHWTALGSYYAYVTWCDEIGLQENRLDDFKINRVTEEFRGTLDSKVNLSFDKDYIDLYELTEDIEYSLIYENGTMVKDSLFDMEKLVSKDKYGIYLGGNHSIIEINTSVKNGKSILILKDSFANCFISYIINQFENIYILDLRYYNQSLHAYIKAHEITDILVLYSLSEFAEDSNLYKLIN